MEFLKKNGLGALTLVLCMILLAAAVLRQKNANARQERIDSLTEALEERESQLEELQEQLTELREEMPDEPICTDYSIQNADVDIARREITLSVSVTLDQNAEYSNITVAAHRPGVAPGENEQWPRVYSWEEVNGALTGSMIFPFEENSPVALTLIYTRSGEIYSQELCSYASMAALLPVSVEENSGEMGYNMSGDGRMYQAHRTVTLANGVSVQNARFCMEKNGLTALEAPAKAFETSGEYSGIGLEGQGVACGPGDWVELHFTCTDQFGIGYDFTLHAWEINAEEKAVERWPAADTITLTWPE